VSVQTSKHHVIETSSAPPSPSPTIRSPRPSRPSSKTVISKMAAVATLPKEVSKLGGEVKLFGKWETQEFVPYRCRALAGVVMIVPILHLVASRSRISPSPTTSKFVTPSIFHTPPVVMPRSSSRRLRCPSSNVLLIGAQSSAFQGSSNY
jgi:hypothetical protein